MAGKERADEAGHRREAERPEDPVRVHVVDAGIDVPGALTKLLVAGGLHAVLVLGATHHGVQRQVRDRNVAPLPHVGAILLDDFRSLVFVRSGQVLVEERRRLHDVVVHAD